MKNAIACAKQLKSVLKKAYAAAPEAPDPIENPVGVIIMSFLMWEGTTDQAEAAYTRLFGSVVDLNDLRVTMPLEMTELAGIESDPELQRFERLRACLKDIFMREHEVDLERLTTVGKRDAKKYIESLDGIVSYVAARTLLSAFQVHTIPVDEQLKAALVEAGAADEDATHAEISSWLARQIKAEEGQKAHVALQAWAEVHAAAARKKKPRKTTPKKTAKKAPAKSTTRKTSSAGTKKTARKSTTKKTTAKKTSAKTTTKKTAKASTKKTAKKSAAKKTTKKTSAASKKKTTRKKK